MIKFIKWFFSTNHVPIVEEHIDFYQKFVELEEQYQGLLQDVRRLEEENIENTNLIYELTHSIDAVDRRIDILANEWSK
jgi:hypothetical protein